MRRAFENVIRNAIKYTAPGTTVDVSIRRAPGTDRALITIGDRGPGLPPKALEAVFEPFYRAEGTSDRDGFGLGLAIA